MVLQGNSLKMESRESFGVDGRELSDRAESEITDSVTSVKPNTSASATSVTSHDAAKLLKRPKGAPRSLTQQQQPPAPVTCTCGFAHVQEEREKLRKARLEAKVRSLEGIRRRQVFPFTKLSNFSQLCNYRIDEFNFFSSG